jgi:hypothetical protein
MFAGSQDVQVSQTPDGLIRITQADAPSDLLNVRIHHLTFGSRQVSSGSLRQKAFSLTGPWIAIVQILMSPEVQEFRLKNNLAPFGFRWPGNANGGFGQSAPGELEDVTVAQALDYLLKTFPGYWVYGNCKTEEGNREAFLWLLPRLPMADR